MAEKLKTLKIKDLNEVGRYAVGMHWSDGHESIFPLDNLRRSCPCLKCRGEMKEELIRRPPRAASTDQARRRRGLPQLARRPRNHLYAAPTAGAVPMRLLRGRAGEADNGGLITRPLSREPGLFRSQYSPASRARTHSRFATAPDRAGPWETAAAASRRCRAAAAKFH